MWTYLMCTAMEHPDVLVRHDVYRSVLDVSEFDEVGLKGEDPWVAERKADGCAFPVDTPFWSRSPPVAVNEEGKFRVIKKEFAIETLDVNGFDVLLAGDEVE